jgi:hypothetical protein
MVERFTSELITLLPAWQRTLIEHPSQLESLELDVHAAFAGGADLLVAGLMAVAMGQDEFLDDSLQTHQDFAQPLALPRQRTIRIRLLGGLVMWVASLYCQPRRQGEEKVSGVYVELAQFGCGKGVSPGLESRVARQAALCPSFELAREQLQRDGVDLDVKTVQRITYQCGEGLLMLRRQQLELWREGRLEAGTELHGQRVSVQIDGGRTRMRSELREASPPEERVDADGLVTEDTAGRSKRRPRRTFESPWRKPKLVTIFVHDEQGRMVKHSRATFEGTFLGPDALAELVAMHLHRLGAAGARSVTFCSDGASWIWDRVSRIVELAKLGNVPVHQVLDCCHAVHHISLALAGMGLDAAERMPLYRQHRTLLRNGQWRRVVEELSDLAGDPAEGVVATEIAYLRKHGEAGRLSYAHFRKLGIPLGSGAIESGIRRVINLRLKSNAMFWREPNAEAMLQVRAQVIGNRWDSRMSEVRTLRRTDGRRNWEWTPQSMSEKVEAENANAI